MAGPSNGALARFRVIDLTRVRSGPTAVRQLADWGAQVIKVESIGDDGGFTSRDTSDFQNLHRNKRCITLNLKEARGRSDGASDALAPPPMSSTLEPSPIAPSAADTNGSRQSWKYLSGKKPHCCRSNANSHRPPNVNVPATE